MFHVEHFRHGRTKLFHGEQIILPMGKVGDGLLPRLMKDEELANELETELRGLLKNLNEATDKLNRGEANLTLKTVRAKTATYATAQLFSATHKTGVDEARQTVLGLLSAPPASVDRPPPRC